MFKHKDNTKSKAPSTRTWTGLTPVGVASWPKLNTPESYNNSPLKYSVKLCFDEGSKEAQTLSKSLDEMVAWMEEEGLTPLMKKKGTAVYPLKPEMQKVKDEDSNVIDEEPTGRVYISASMYAKKKDGSPNTLPFVDSLGEGISRPPEVHGGSRLRLKVWAKPYYMNSTNEYGISFSLNAVQIVELSEGYADAGPGFDAVEGGWTATDGLEAASSTEDTPF